MLRLRGAFCAVTAGRHELERQLVPAALSQAEAVAEAVFAVGLRESKPQLQRRGEAVVKGREAIAEPDLQAVGGAPRAIAARRQPSLSIGFEV